MRTLPLLSSTFDDGGVPDAATSLAAVGEHKLHRAATSFAADVAADARALTDERVEGRIGWVRSDRRVVDADGTRQIVQVKVPAGAFYRVSR